jgi:hypothetical protein
MAAGPFEEYKRGELGVRFDSNFGPIIIEGFIVRNNTLNEDSDLVQLSYSC